MYLSMFDPITGTSGNFAYTRFSQGWRVPAEDVANLRDCHGFIECEPDGNFVTKRGEHSRGIVREP